MPTATDCVIQTDLADVWTSSDRKNLIRTLTLGWGDQVKVLKTTATHLEIELTDYVEQPDGSILPHTTTGYIKPTASSKIKPKDVVRPLEENTVLRVNFVDVQQGSRCRPPSAGPEKGKR